MKDVSINRLDSPARRCVMHTREARCHAGRGRGRAPRAHTDPVRGGSASPLKEGSAPNPDPSRLSLGSCRGLLPPDDLSGVVATRRSSIPLDPTPSSLPARALEQSHAARPGNAAGSKSLPRPCQRAWKSHETTAGPPQSLLSVQHHAPGRPTPRPHCRPSRVISGGPRSSGCGGGSCHPGLQP